MNGENSILFETAYAPETSGGAQKEPSVHEFQKFMIQTNIKKILMYFTEDSLLTVRQAA